MKGKILLLLAAVVVLVAGVVLYPGSPSGNELSAGHVVMRSESMEDGAFCWCFDAEDGSGNPLDTVFYTEEWSPAPDGGTVAVTVRLYDSPAEGRTALQRTVRGNSTSPEFVLTCVCPGELSRQYPQASYHIRFCGRSLGTWRLDGGANLAAVLTSPL